MVKLNDYIDFEDAVAKALADGLHNKSVLTVKLTVCHEHIAEVKAAIERFRDYRITIDENIVIDDYAQQFTEFTVTFMKVQ